MNAIDDEQVYEFVSYLFTHPCASAEFINRLLVKLYPEWMPSAKTA